MWPGGSLGAGDDRLYVRGVGDVEPGAGNDLIVARPVKDRYSAPCVSYVRLARGIVANLTRGWVQAQGRDQVRGVQCLYGTRFADQITGSPRNDTLEVCLWSGWGVDRGRNTVHAGAGNDEVDGCNGPGDRVYMGDGRDLFMGVRVTTMPTVTKDATGSMEALVATTSRAGTGTTP